MPVKKEVLGILRRCDVFLGLTDDELSKISALPSCQVRLYKAGQVLFREEEEAETLYIVVEGRVLLTMKMLVGTKIQEEVVDAITKGSILGWASLVVPHTFTFNARCLIPSKLLSIKGSELLQFLNKEPYIGYEVTKSILRVSSSRLRDVQRLLLSNKIQRAP